MKRVTISTLIVFISFISTAQDKALYAFHAAEGILPDSLKHQSEILADNVISNTSSVPVDGDGNSYDIVKIGNQVWMAGNLKTTKFNDGTEIPMVSDNGEWRNLGSPGFCWYDNNLQGHKGNYGALYNWYTVSTGKLCPEGWHIPSREEWMTLIKYCGENSAGGQLKAAGLDFWESPNADATDAMGFTALPGGSRLDIGIFSDKGLRGRWWSSTEFNGTNVWDSNMSASYSRVTGSLDDKKNGLSVRCIKD